MSGSNNSNSMDIDSEPATNGAAQASSSGSPKNNASAQANFSVPIPNGTSGGDGAPAPPPHKPNPSSPVTTAEEDAESYKAAGNRHFKEKNYPKAIEQYSKGMHDPCLPSLVSIHLSTPSWSRTKDEPGGTIWGDI